MHKIRQKSKPNNEVNINELFTLDTSNDDLASLFELECEEAITEAQLREMVTRTMAQVTAKKITSKIPLSKNAKINHRAAFGFNVFPPLLRVVCILSIILLLTSTSVFAASLIASSFVKTYIPGGNVIIDNLYGATGTTDTETTNTGTPDSVEESTYATTRYLILEQPHDFTMNGYTIQLLKIIYDGMKLDVTYKTTYSDGKRFSDFDDGISYYALKVKQADGTLAIYEEKSIVKEFEEVEKHLIFQVNSLKDCDFILQEVKEIETPLYTVDGVKYTNLKEEIINTELISYSFEDLPLVEAKQIGSLSETEKAVTSNGITLLAESSYQGGTQHIGISFDSINGDEIIDSYGYTSYGFGELTSFQDEQGTSYNFSNEASPFGERSYFEIETPSPLSGTLTIPYLSVKKHLNTSFEFDVPAPGSTTPLNLSIEAGGISMIVTSIECSSELVDDQYSLTMYIDLPKNANSERLKLLDNYIDCLLESGNDKFYFSGGSYMDSTQLQGKMLINSNTKHASIKLIDMLCRIQGNWELPINMP